MPDLTAIDGDRLTGEEIFLEAARFIAEQVAHVPVDDPYRGSLVAFAMAGGHKIRPALTATEDV